MVGLLSLFCYGKKKRKKKLTRKIFTRTAADLFFQSIFQMFSLFSSFVSFAFFVFLFLLLVFLFFKIKNTCSDTNSTVPAGK